MSEDSKEYVTSMATMYQQGFLDGALTMSPYKQDPKLLWESIKKKCLKSWNRFLKTNYKGGKKSNDNIKRTSRSIQTKTES